MAFDAAAHRPFAVAGLGAMGGAATTGEDDSERDGIADGNKPAAARIPADEAHRASARVSPPLKFIFASRAFAKHPARSDRLGQCEALRGSAIPKCPASPAAPPAR